MPYLSAETNFASNNTVLSNNGYQDISNRTLPLTTQDLSNPNDSLQYQNNLVSSLLLPGQSLSNILSLVNSNIVNRTNTNMQLNNLLSTLKMQDFVERYALLTRLQSQVRLASNSLEMDLLVPRNNASLRFPLISSIETPNNLFPQTNAPQITSQAQLLEIISNMIQNNNTAG